MWLCAHVLVITRTTSSLLTSQHLSVRLSFFLEPLDQFSHFVTEKTCFCAMRVDLCVRTTGVVIWGICPQPPPRK